MIDYLLGFIEYAHFVALGQRLSRQEKVLLG